MADKQIQTNSIKDNTFVITGQTETDRDKLKAEIMAYGGRCTLSISGKTTFLVVGDEPGQSKIKKAQQFKVKEISEDNLKEMLKKAAKSQSIEDVEFDAVKGLSDNEFEEIEEEFKELEKNDKKSVKKIKLEKQRELWVEKYRPKNLKDFCGNKAAMEKLKDFIKTPIRELQKKAVCIIGAPGIGKTTAAQIICKSAGKSFLEFNASDVRNKKSIADISQIRRTLNLKKNKSEHSIIIMDEVDGISDRGGLPELVNFIKKTKNHIICLANEKNLKLKTLLNHAEEIHFRRLELKQIKPRIEEILKEEGIKINPVELNKLLLKGHGDFRFILNQLQAFAAGHLSLDASKIENKTVFENVMSVFSNKNVGEKLDTFFEDADFIPLLMHENYIKPPFYGSKPNINDLFHAAESLSLSEHNNSIKGKTQNYSFGYMQAYWSTRPHLRVGRCDFSGWLGQNSKRRKNANLVRMLYFHNSESLNSKETYRLYKLPLIFKKMVDFMQNKEAIKCINFLKETGFLKGDIDNLIAVIDQKFPESRSLKTACRKNSWTFPYESEN